MRMTSSLSAFQRTCSVTGKMPAVKQPACSPAGLPFTQTWPTLICTIGYGTAFWLLSLALKTIPTGMAYAAWSGLGTVLIVLVAWLWQGQKLDAPALAGIGLIVSGVAVINLFSRTVSH